MLNLLKSFFLSFHLFYLQNIELTYNKIEFDTIKLELEKTLTNKDFRILFNCKREVKKINILDITNDIYIVSPRCKWYGKRIH